ncbi:MAG: hypothetical protein ACR2MB_15740, partial [Acidimicrobiales bacterium]
MNDHEDLDPANEDPVLSSAGARLRESVAALSAPAVVAAVLRRKARRMAVVAGVSVVAVAVLGGLLLLDGRSKGGDQVVSERPGAPPTNEVDHLLRSLDDQPVDPRRVRLIASVSTFDNC